MSFTFTVERTLIDELDSNLIKFGFTSNNIRRVIFYNTELPVIDFIKLAENTVISTFTNSAFYSIVLVMDEYSIIEKRFIFDFACGHDFSYNYLRFIDTPLQIKGIFKLSYTDGDPKNLYELKEILTINDTIAKQWQRQSNICN